MTLWHGFKSYAEKLATRIRDGIGSGPDDALDVESLVERFAIDIVRLSDVPDQEAAAHFQGPAGSKLSGMVLPVDGRHLMVYNDTHGEARIRSTFTHEASHVVLNHDFRPKLIDGRHCDTPHRDQEDEAAELGGELLIPRRAARTAVLDHMSPEDLAEHFNTSNELAQWRMNLSGGPQIRKHRSRF